MLGGELWIVGDGATVVQAASDADDAVLFAFADGASPTTLLNLEIVGHIDTGSDRLRIENCTFTRPGPMALNRSALFVSAGHVELLSVRFSGLPGGALQVAPSDGSNASGAGAPYVRVWDSVFSSCQAVRGAAVNMSGGVLVISRCAIEDNTATDAGGALAVSGGTVLLRNGTFLWNNDAPVAKSILVEGTGLVFYGLPAPLGKWVIAPILCDMYRVACAAGDSECVPGEQQLLEDQPCDWEGIPDMLGLTIAELSNIDEDYPLDCRPRAYLNLLRAMPRDLTKPRANPPGQPRARTATAMRRPTSRGRRVRACVRQAIRAVSRPSPQRVV